MSSGLDRWDRSRERQRAQVRELVTETPMLADVLASGFLLEVGKLAQAQPVLSALLDGARDLLGQFSPVRDAVVVVDAGAMGVLSAGLGAGAGVDGAPILEMARTDVRWADGDRRVIPLLHDGELAGALAVVEPPVMAGDALLGSVAGALARVLGEGRHREAARRAGAPARLEALLARPPVDSSWADQHRLEEVVAALAGLGELTGAGIVVQVGGRMAPVEVWVGRRAPVSETIRRLVGDGEVTLEVVGGAWARGTGAAVLDRVAERVGEQVRRLDEWRQLGTDTGTGLPDRTLGGMLLSEARRRMDAEDDTLAVIGVAVDDGPGLRQVGRDGDADRLLGQVVSALRLALPTRELVRTGPDRLAVVAESTLGWGARQLAGEVHDACRAGLRPTGLVARVPTARLAVVGWSPDEPGAVSRDLLAELDVLLDGCPPDGCAEA